MDPSTLRNRATRLRSLALWLEQSTVHSLAGASGPETWQCPAADAYLEQLGLYGTRLGDAAGDLRWQGTLLDRQADDLEAELRAEAAIATAP